MKSTPDLFQIIHILPIIVLTVKQGTSITQYFTLPSNISKIKQMTTKSVYNIAIHTVYIHMYLQLQ